MPSKASERSSEQIFGKEDGGSPFFFNAPHWHAYDGVREGLSRQAGVLVLCGPMGSGKTLLMRKIASALGDERRAVFLQYAGLSAKELINFLYNALDAGVDAPDARSKAHALRDALYGLAGAGKSAVVFIDDAQCLSDEVLQMLPRLIALDKLQNGCVVGLQFVLCGGGGLRKRLAGDAAAALRKSVDRSFPLRYFSKAEVQAFLQQRLAPIARMAERAIEPEAVDRVVEHTRGNPRLISMICSHAMLFAAENPGHPISAQMIDEAAEALMIDQKRDDQAEAEQDQNDIDFPAAGAVEEWSIDEILSAAEEPEFQPSAAGSAGKPRFSLKARCAEAARRRARKPRRNVRTVVSGAWIRRAKQVAAVVGALALGGGAYSFAPTAINFFETVQKGAQTNMGGLAEKAESADAAARTVAQSIGDSISAGAKRARNIKIPVDKEKVRGAAGEVVAHIENGAIKAAAVAMEGASGKLTQAAHRVNAPDPIKGIAVGAAQGVADVKDAVVGQRELINARAKTPGDIISAKRARADQMTAHGDKLFDLAHYTEPQSDNAYAFYRKALLLDPRNTAARKGVNRIRDIYSNLARDARDQENWSLANTMFGRALLVSQLKDVN